ncbi:MAG TPA: glycosyl hydrolase [Puia sp.]
MNFKPPLLLIFLLSFFRLNAQETADPHATPATRALFRNLQRLSGKKILFGHQDDPAYGVGWKYEKGRSDIRGVTGEFPGVYGFDLGRIELDQDHNLDGVPFEKTRQYIMDAYARGGVITLSWHLNNPLTGSTAWDNKPGAVASILPGGEKNELYTKWLDRVAGFLQKLKGAKREPIPVILRLFHELNGGWFWWGKDQCSPEEIKSLWHFTIHYLTHQKKIHQLLFAYNTDRFNSIPEYLERYPGDAWIDILGFDIYQANNIKENSAFAAFFEKDLDLLDRVAAEHGKIPALTEFGYNQVPDSNWWTGTFLPVIEKHRVVYALAWRNAGAHENGSQEFYVPYPGQASAADFKKMFRSGKIIFETSLQTEKIYK